jgi:regulator of sirC expression with transglutaminase-like and TPR domain
MSLQGGRFAKIAASADDTINLAEGALVIASEEYPGLDIGAYLVRLDEMGATLKRRLRADISPADTIVALNRFVFEENGFTGNSADYYDARNSFLNEVLDRKRGIPITLAIVYIEIGRRIGLPLQGISFPGHFLVKCPLREGAVILDPYARGMSLGLDELRKRVKALGSGTEPPDPVIANMLAAAGNKEILARMLRNLKAIYTHHKDWIKALSAADRIITIMPLCAEEYRDRGTIYVNLECFRAALFDLQAYLQMLPAAKDADTVREQVVELQTAAARLN